MTIKPKKNTSFSNLFAPIIYDPQDTNTPSLDIWTAYFTYATPIGFNESLYTTYRLASEDTIEGIAQKVYGDVNLWWLIPLANDIEDPFDFLENVSQNDGFENSEIKVFSNQFLPQIITEISRQVRKNTTDFERQNRK